MMLLLIAPMNLTKKGKIIYMRKELFVSTLLLFICLGASSQDTTKQKKTEDTDISKLLEEQLKAEDKNKTQFVSATFKTTRLVNGHTIETTGKGVLDVKISHRFGPLGGPLGGAYNFFGLDVATMRMGFDYALGKNVTIGVGRTTFKKELDGFIKWRPVRQATGGSSFSWVLVTGMSVYTFKNTDPQNKASFSSRVGYYYQSIFGRKFSKRFSLQLSPTLVHRNKVETGDVNDIYAIGIGSRFKLSKRTAFVIDYFPVFNRPKNSITKDAFSVGFDIETGGHVFQLHFSNATGMNERAFITDTQDSWGRGEIRFGFNLSRVFTVKKNRN